MKRVLSLIGLLLMMSPCMYLYGQTSLRPRGDVNCDWKVSIDDVTDLINMMLKGVEYHSFYTYAADIDSDKTINIEDVVCLINGLLSRDLSPMPAYSGTLPVLFINTEDYRDIDSKDDYLHADWWLDNMGHEEFESIGSATEPMGMLIKGHGNYTWNKYDKKSFRIKLDDKEALMGMHSNRHFILLAHADDNLAKLKNTMGFELSRRIGLAYTPAQEPVEVVLNGQYIGLYFLTEKIRVGKHRVDIEEQMDGETELVNISGGWLLEIDNSPTPGEFVTIHERPGSNGKPVRLEVSYHSPEKLSHEQKTYLKRLLQNANTAIFSSDKMSMEWERYIDIDTLAMYYIVGEMMDDLEYFAGSCYMYKHRGDSTKLIFGPVWDFGNAFQRWAIYDDTEFNKFIFEQPTPFISHWIEELVEYPHFRKVVRDHWQAFYESGFNGLDIDLFINEFVERIEAAFNADGERWKPRAIDYQQKDFKRFIHRKIIWLNTQWGADN